MPFEIRPFERPSSPQRSEAPASHPATQAYIPASEIVPARPKAAPAPKLRKGVKQKHRRTHGRHKSTPAIPRLELSQEQPPRSPARHSFALPDARAPLTILYSVVGKIGTSGYLPCEAHPNNTLRKAIAEGWFQDEALRCLSLGYAVEWHDQDRWFIATHPTQPTIWCALREVSNV